MFQVRTVSFRSDLLKLTVFFHLNNRKHVAQKFGALMLHSVVLVWGVPKPWLTVGKGLSCLFTLYKKAPQQNEPFMESTVSLATVLARPKVCTLAMNLSERSG